MDRLDKKKIAGGRSLTTILIAAMLMLMLMSTSAFAVEPLKASLILGDHQAKPAIDALKELAKDYPELKERISWGVYVKKTLGEKERTFIKQSRLILVFMMGRELSDAVTPELKDAIAQGAKVYAFGGTYDDDQKAMGIISDRAIESYSMAGGAENMKNMLLYALSKGLKLPVTPAPPGVSSSFGIYDRTSKRLFESYDEFRKAYTSFKEGKPWAGVIFYKSSLDSSQTKPLDALIEALEASGNNVLPIFGYPSHAAIEKFFFDPSGRPRVDVVVAVGMKMAMDPAVVVPLLSRLDVPVIDAISLYSQSQEEWKKSAKGLDIFERSWQIANTETGGLIQPTVFASKEKMTDRETGIEYMEERPIAERVEMLVSRTQAWLNLRHKLNKDKKIAIIYYNYPPGKQNIGASYLNVMPESLFAMLGRLKAEGYDVESHEPGAMNREITKEQLFADISGYGRNIGNWAQAEIDRLARSGRAVLIPLETYKKWFAELPETLRNSVIKSWGPVEDSSIMIWKGEDRKKYIVIPAVQYGNILFTAQPSRGWEQDPVKMYHDVSAPPHHQYIAFYLWLRHGFKADAVVHVGTHGTHEWLSGKEAGLSDEDPPEALIRDIPNIYPYLVDDVGEGIQAKRRGMAVIIDHMTPPFDKAGMSKELKELSALISDYNNAKEKSAALAQTRIEEVSALAQKTGILKDIGLKPGAALKLDDLDDLDDYIREISEKQTPFGLHTFGKPPEDKYRKSTAEAIISIEKGLSEEERKKRIEDYEQRMIRSGARELDSFVAALAGKYIPTGQGNDPIRNPDSLPTGKNFYAFDPTRIPSKAVYSTGMKLANELIEGYKSRHGTYPDKLSFNLWAVETITNEGIMESQILYLMGIRPRWDERGRVIGVEAIPRSELGRQRIDVTIVPSGLYRDLFPNLMDLLDKAVTLSKNQEEEDNTIRRNVIKTREMLIAKGIAEEKAERLATVRIFTEPSGAYGNGIGEVIVKSDSWSNEKKVVDVFFNRTSYLYGQGFWGEKGESQGSSNQEDMGKLLFKNALSGVKIAVHGRSSNLIGVLDNDDVYQYLGGMAMAVRAVDGKTPEVYVTNLSNPKDPKQESIDKYMGREMRSRYLNPEWIKAMMKEGYEGARFVDKMVENLWGWQVTAPEAVDAAKWNEIYETYVLDRNGLGIKELFRESKNMFAYQSLVARMIETIRKNYWKPDKKVIDTLAKEYAQSVKETGLACCEHTCNNPLLTQFTAATLLSIPGMRSLVTDFMKAHEAIRQPQSGGDRTGRQAMRAAGSRKASSGAPKDNGKAKTKPVEGYEMKESSNAAGASSAPIPWVFIAGFMVFIGLVAFGFRKR